MQLMKYNSRFKAKVALEVVKGLKTFNDIAPDRGVHPNMLTKGKKQLFEGMPVKQPRRAV